MGIIPPGVHRIIDYLAVLAFAAAPLVFHLTGRTLMLDKDEFLHRANDAGISVVGYPPLEPHA